MRTLRLPLYHPMCLLSLASTYSAAQGPVELAVPSLEEVLVTATRNQTQLHNLPYSITVIDKDERLLQQVRSLTEAIAQIPGVRIQKTANGQGSPFIRGFTGYRTLALIDGVRYNNSVYRDGPNEYFSLIDFNSIHQIELLNGPASVLYGSDAIGGSLNLSSQASSYQEQMGHFFGGQQQLRYSSAEQSNLSRTQVDLGKADDWGLLAGFSLKDFGQVKAAQLGQLPSTDYQEQAFDLRLDKKLNHQWQMTALHQDLRQDDVWRSHSTLFSRSFAGTSIGTDQRRLKDQERQLSYIKLRGQQLEALIDEASITLSRQHWREDSERTRSNSSRIEEYFDSTMWGLDLQLGTEWKAGRWIYGFDIYHDQVDTGRFNFATDGSLDSIGVQGPVGDKASFTQAGIYGQWQWRLKQQWQLTAGSRYSWVKAKVGRFAAPDTGAASAYQDNWKNLSSSLRLKYQQSEPQQFWAGISQSFRAPNIADISRFGKSRSNEIEVAALGLKPEKFLSYELGWRYLEKHWELQSNLFYTDIKDYITSTATGNIRQGLVEVSKQNSANGYMRGIEVSTRYRFNSQWLWQASYSIAQGKQTLANGSKAYFSRTMPAQYNTRLDWFSQDGLHQISLNISHSAHADKLSPGDLGDLERIPPGGTPAYTLIDISSRWTINENLEWLLQLNNLGDKAYRSHGSGSNEPGRGITAGLDWRF